MLSSIARLTTLLSLFLLVLPANAYQVLISSQDEVRQVCSGMYGHGKEDAFIEVIFAASSRGQLALVIFEWEDAKYLGVDPSGSTSDNAWTEDQRVYICTLSALEANLCSESDLGKFITTPSSLSSSNSSIFTASFSLTAFLMWIMVRLLVKLAILPITNPQHAPSGASTAQSPTSPLAAKPSRNPVRSSPPSFPPPTNTSPTVFTKLYRILVVAVIIIGAFFIISSLSFSNRLDQDFGPKTWQTRWVLLDGWLGVLYALVFCAIAFLWRPTANNRRLALSDELPTDEQGAEDYEVDALDRDGSDKEAIPLNSVGRDEVVFDVGEDEEGTSYNAAKAAGLIPSIPPSKLDANGNTAYPTGVDPGAAGACSWTITHCFGAYDTVDAPAGIVGISFDDGPQLASPPLYQYLQSQGQAATHFMIGSRIVDNPGIFQQAVSTGGHIAIHTWSHPHMTTLTDMQILGELGWTAQIINDLSGIVPAFWRPPYGDLDNRVRAIAREVFGLYNIVWNQDTFDWCLIEGGGNACPGSGPGTDTGLDSELQGFYHGPKSPGLIILEHELTSRSVGGFIRNFPTLKSQGWIPKAIPDIWSVPWYNTAIAVGAGRGVVNSTTSTSSTQSSSLASSSSAMISSSASSQASASSAASSTAVAPSAEVVTSTAISTSPNTVASLAAVSAVATAKSSAAGMISGLGWTEALVSVSFVACLLL
ncbi:chitin deacetylase, partial [Phenoliferia sp. Uapishka_3]